MEFQKHIPQDAGDKGHLENDKFCEWYCKQQLLFGNHVTHLITAKQNAARGNIQRLQQIIRIYTKQPSNVLRNPLLLLPEEVWLMVFNKLKDVKDLISTSSASFVLNRIMNKPEYLLELVFPNIDKLLAKSDVLNCRLVCSKWRHGIDKYLENYFPGCNSLNPWKSSFCEYSQRNEEFRFQYNCHWGNTRTGHETKIPNQSYNSNPLIGRVVLFDYSGSEKYMTVLTSINIFLKNVGAYIWYLRVDCLDNYFPFNCAADFYTTYRNILIGCPNLKACNFAGSIYDDDGLKDTTLNGDLPALPFLEELSVSISHTDVFDRILEGTFVEHYFQQLKRLFVQAEALNFSKISKKPCLKHLNLYFAEKNRNAVLQNLLHIEAPQLQVLGIINNQFSGCDKVPFFQDLLRACNHFPNLYKLKLKMEEPKDGVMDTEIYSLPQDLYWCTSVSSLELELRVLQLSFTFLICFPLLEQLKIIYTKPYLPRYDDSLGAINLGRYLVEDSETMYQSNVWEMLPSLKVLKVEKRESKTQHVYTRHEYNALVSSSRN